MGRTDVRVEWMLGQTDSSSEQMPDRYDLMEEGLMW